MLLHAAGTFLRACPSIDLYFIKCLKVVFAITVAYSSVSLSPRLHALFNGSCAPKLLPKACNACRSYAQKIEALARSVNASPPIHNPKSVK